MHVAIIYNFKSHESITKDVCETLISPPLETFAKKMNGKCKKLEIF